MGRKETEEAIADCRAGRVSGRFASVDELMADLNSDDAPDGEVLTPYDPAEDLRTAEAIALFLAEAEKAGDPAYIEHAREVATRAKAMHGIG